MLRMGYCGGCNRMSDIKLYNGDCLELMKLIPDKSIDLILTDPPYKITARGNGGNSDRDFIGIELDEGYYNIAKERIESAQSEINNCNE